MYLRRGLGSVSTAQATIQSLAPSYGIPPSLALAVAKQESGFNQSAVSPKGALGVMQLMPGTASDLGVDASDESQNIAGGLDYLSQMYQKFGNWTQALEAYNAGPNGNLAGSSGYANAILANAGPLGDPAPVDLSSVDLSGVDSGGAAASDSSGVDLSSLTSDSSGSGLSSTVMIALAAAAVGLVVWAAAA